MKYLYLAAIALLFVAIVPAEANAACYDPITGEPCSPPTPTSCPSDFEIPWGAIEFTCRIIIFGPLVIPVEEEETPPDQTM